MGARVKPEPEHPHAAQVKLPGRARVAVAGGAESGEGTSEFKGLHEYSQDFADLFAKGIPPPLRQRPNHEESWPKRPHGHKTGGAARAAKDLEEKFDHRHRVKTKSTPPRNGPEDD